jgi:hypothetical protein
MKYDKLIIEGKVYGTDYFEIGEGRTKEDNKRTVTERSPQNNEHYHQIIVVYLTSLCVNWVFLISLAF